MIVPEDGISEDYGYLTCIIAPDRYAKEHALPLLTHWYDGQEHLLAPDAADGDAVVEWLEK